MQHRRLTVCGKSGEVSGATITSWKERLLENLRGYDEENIFNLDETGCFSGGHSLVMDLVREERSVMVGKKVKQRFTIAFLVNAAGAKEKPIVIWIVKNQDVLED